jgi:hypothetical protein
VIVDAIFERYGINEAILKFDAVWIAIYELAGSESTIAENCSDKEATFESAVGEIETGNYGMAEAYVYKLFILHAESSRRIGIFQNVWLIKEIFVRSARTPKQCDEGIFIKLLAIAL